MIFLLWTDLARLSSDSEKTEYDIQPFIKLVSHVSVFKG